MIAVKTVLFVFMCFYAISSYQSEKAPLDIKVVSSCSAVLLLAMIAMDIYDFAQTRGKNDLRRKSCSAYRRLHGEKKKQTERKEECQNTEYTKQSLE